MKTTVVCGLLGSGKTTFIQKFAEKVDGKTVVLVNDFGKAGIDGEIFSSDGIESIELPSGCVCCTLKFDLITTLQRIVENLSPENLLIEPSGVASPSGVLEALDILQISPVTVIGIIDSTEFLELHEAQMYGSFFEDQIVTSDIILVNKTDLAGEEKVTATAALVETMNPGAIVFRTVRAAIDEPLPGIQEKTRVAARENSHLHFETLTLRLKKESCLPRVEALFKEMSDGVYGNVVRAKALIRTDKGPYRFDLTYGKIDCAPFGKCVEDSRLVIIGEGLQKEALQGFSL